MVKNPPAKAEDRDLITGLRRSPGEGNGNPLKYSCLGDSMDRGDWRLQSMGLQRVRHNRVNEHAAATSLQACQTVQPCGLQPTRLLCPWDFPGKSTGEMSMNAYGFGEETFFSGKDLLNSFPGKSF